MANASLTDCVFEVERTTTVGEINQLLKRQPKMSLRIFLGTRNVR
ncbi:MULTISPECIES: hypothetical protein [unclassified Methylophaga]|nr:MULTISPECIES: hypothetical protein [unclassified Methylophaga]